MKHRQVRLFLGNIPFRATEEEIAEFCAPVAARVIQVTIPADRETGKTKGYAFAEIVLREQAPEDDWKRLDKRMIQGRQINVELEIGRSMQSEN